MAASSAPTGYMTKCAQVRGTTLVPGSLPEAGSWNGSFIEKRLNRGVNSGF